MNTKISICLRILLSISVLYSLSAQVALAEETDCDDPVRHRMGAAFSFSPRYYGLNTDGYSPAFLSGGLMPPGSGTVGGEFLFYLTSQTDWQFGVGFGGLSYTNESGSSIGEYRQDYFGLWVAKVWPITDDFEVSFGSLFSGGWARQEVLSPAANGRTRESSFMLEPKLSALYRVARWLKVGVSGSYLEPLAQNVSVNGQNLTPGNISTHGASVGVEFNFFKAGY